MAEPGADLAAKMPVQTRAALTRKHLRRDQAAARKSKGKVVATDTLKERQVNYIVTLLTACSMAVVTFLL